MSTQNNKHAWPNRLIPSSLVDAAKAIADSLKINSISERSRCRRPVIVKSRNLGSEQIADLANLYFRMADIPIRFWSKVNEWRRWEINCFRMLNGDRFQAVTFGPKAICLDKVPGESAWDHMQRGTLTPQILRAAAKEFHRAHQIWSDEYDGPWSHGDATTTNVIFNQKTGRARLIDFEIMHEKSLAATARHADDLLVFLLDLVGIVPDRDWLPFALCFVRAYGDEDVVAELRKKLVAPAGLAWIWWGVRANFTKPAKIKRRLKRLRDAIAKFELRQSVVRRVRHKRRPSNSCHVIKPGMPRPSSRTRLIKERAKALSPGIPSKFPTIR